MSLNTTAVRIKVTLKDVKPEVMRRLVVPVTLRLDRLHLTLQEAFGWTNTPEFVREYHDAHTSLRQPRAGTFMTIIAQYKAAPEFTGLAASTRRAYLAYIKLIEDAFGDLPVAALADRRVRGEFKTWRDSFAETPRKADYAWTTLARVMSFAKDRGIIATNPCERGGRLYVADRKDKIWTEQDIAAVLAVASSEIQLALILALWSGQRQGDLLRLPRVGLREPLHSPSPVEGRSARRDAGRRSSASSTQHHKTSGVLHLDEHAGIGRDGIFLDLPVHTSCTRGPLTN